MSLEELKKFAYEWLMNEKLLGEDTLEIVGPFRRAHRFRPTVQPMKVEELLEYQKSVMGCRRCDLHKTCNNLVFGEGNSESPLVFIGEAPGREEDEVGRPFVGEAGKLLTKLLKSIGVERKDVYITNIIKCRPPENRDPTPEEIDKCREWLIGQLEIIKPKIICTLGRYATLSLIGQISGIGTTFSKVRGRVYEWRNIKVIPTYHPAALLYHPVRKEKVMEDLKLVKELLRFNS